MPGILSLPNELIINIFLASPAVHDALRLSGASRLFRAIFIEHEILIVEGILRPQIPAFDDASTLAVTETRLLDKEVLTNLSSNGHLPLRFCILRLLRNAELASSACADCASWKWPEWSHRRRRSDPLPRSSPASYYFIRQAVLAYDHGHLRHSLYRKLRTAPQEWTERQHEFVEYLNAYADLEVKHKHGIIMEDDDWDPEDCLREILNHDKWEYAAEVIKAALSDHLHGCTRYLEEELRYWPTRPTWVPAFDDAAALAIAETSFLDIKGPTSL
jgi:hypothetical protein